MAELGDVMLSVIIKVNAPSAVGSSALLGCLVKCNLIVNHIIAMIFWKTNHKLPIGKVSGKFGCPKLSQQSANSQNNLVRWRLNDTSNQISDVVVIHHRLNSPSISASLRHPIPVNRLSCCVHLPTKHTTVMLSKVRPEQISPCAKQWQKMFRRHKRESSLTTKLSHSRGVRRGGTRRCDVVDDRHSECANGCWLQRLVRPRQRHLNHKDRRHGCR
jgi:hypothetical protein